MFERSGHDVNMAPSGVTRQRTTHRGPRSERLDPAAAAQLDGGDELAAEGSNLQRAEKVRLAASVTATRRRVERWDLAQLGPGAHAR